MSDAFIATYRDGKRIEINTLTKNATPIDPQSIYFIVQIAASFKPLSDMEIANIYIGKLKIIHIKENGYHKYALGKFNTFQQALDIKNKCNVPDAFIKAYEKNTQINLYKAKIITDNN